MGWTITVPRTPYYKVILRDKPIGYWRLGETSGSTAFDSSGNGLHLTDTSGGPTRGVPGLITGSDTAYDFTSNGWLEHSDDPLFDITGALTIEFWFKRGTPPGQEAFVAKYEGDPGRSYRAIMNPDGKPDISVNPTSAGNNSTAKSTVSYDDNNIHYYCGVFKPGQYIRLYIDGIKVGEETTDVITSIANTSVPFKIGGWFETSETDSIIDEVAIYNKVLTPTQIQQHYRAGI